MKHKVKITVLDKKLYPELQQYYCADPISGVCPAIMLVMNLFFFVIMSVMTSGTWG